MSLASSSQDLALQAAALIRQLNTHEALMTVTNALCVALESQSDADYGIPAAYVADAAGAMDQVFAYQEAA